jgi:coenzyme PQQ synthesis protein D (PqqD)
MVEGAPLMGMSHELTLRVPDTVVFQELPAETVALDLGTGRYHALPAEVARVVELVCGRDGLEAAVRRLAAERGLPVGEVEASVRALCDDLVAHGLLEVVAPIAP